MLRPLLFWAVGLIAFFYAMNLRAAGETGRASLWLILAVILTFVGIAQRMRRLGAPAGEQRQSGGEGDVPPPPRKD